MISCYPLDSIFFDNDRTLFATFKYVGTDFEGDMELMRANPKIREWWAMTDGMQVCLKNNNEGKRVKTLTQTMIPGQPHSWRSEQCRWTRLVEGIGRGVLHGVKGSAIMMMFKTVHIPRFTISGRILSFEKPINCFLLSVVGSTPNTTSSARDIGEMVFVVDF
jgi:hypothetical protein